MNLSLICRPSWRFKFNTKYFRSIPSRVLPFETQIFKEVLKVNIAKFCCFPLFFCLISVFCWNHRSFWWTFVFFHLYICSPSRLIQDYPCILRSLEMFPTLGLFHNSGNSDAEQCYLLLSRALWGNWNIL